MLWDHPHQSTKTTHQNVIIFRKKIVQRFGSDYWLHKDDKCGKQLAVQFVPLERNLYGHPMARLVWERTFEFVQLEQSMRKVDSWECPYFHRKMQLLLSEDPTSPFDQVFLDVLSEQHKSVTDGKTEVDRYNDRCQNSGDTSQRHHSLELRHGRSRSNVYLLNFVVSWRIRRLTNVIRFPHLVSTITM